MTAPFAPPPPRIVWVVLTCILMAVAAMPFTRREDWLGSLAFLMLAGAATVLWSALILAWCHNLAARYRNKV